MRFEFASSRPGRLLRACPHLLPDLLLVLAYVVALDAVNMNGGLGGPVRVVVGFPLLFFVPGYAVLAALFPRYDNDPSSRAFAGVSDGALSTMERTLLSFGVSLALLPLVALALGALGAGFTETSILLGLNSVVLPGITVGAVRRIQGYDSGEWMGSRLEWFSARAARLARRSPADAAVAVALVLVALIATSALGFALVAPGDGESYTNVALLTANEGGELTTSGYPTTLQAGTTVPLVVAVENREDRQVEYTLVGELQRVDRGAGSLSVVERSEVVRVSRSVPDRGTWRENVSVTPAMTGDELRLAFMVYRGDPPPEPRLDNAYQHVHLWVRVSG